MVDVVWSINIMCAILLVAVGVVIYYIFKYDDFWPNDGTQSRNEDSNLGSEGGTYDGPREGTHSESSC